MPGQCAKSSDQFVNGRSSRLDVEQARRYERKAAKVRFGRWRAVGLEDEHHSASTACVASVVRSSSAMTDVMLATVTLTNIA